MVGHGALGLACVAGRNPGPRVVDWQAAAAAAAVGSSRRNGLQVPHTQALSEMVRQEVCHGLP